MVKTPTMHLFQPNGSPAQLRARAAKRREEELGGGAGVAAAGSESEKAPLPGGVLNGPAFSKTIGQRGERAFFRRGRKRRAWPLMRRFRGKSERASETALATLRPGLPERQTHDYKRNGTTTLFAAFNILNGKVIGTCQPRHRGSEFVKFLNHLEKELPADQEVHLILDNYCTHKSKAVQRWLKPKKPRRFHLHFTPTSSSWLNQVERFFAVITGRMIRRGTFHTVHELEQAIYKWLATWNGDPIPFVWKPSADVILDKVRRCKELAATGD
jgi:transposase